MIFRAELNLVLTQLRKIRLGDLQHLRASRTMLEEKLLGPLHTPRGQAGAAFSEETGGGAFLCCMVFPKDS